LKHGKGIKYDYSHFSKTEDCVYEMIIPRTEYTIYSRLYPDSAITYEEWIDCLYSAKIDHITLKEMRSSNNNKFQCPSTETFVNGFDLENNLSIDVPYFVAEKTPLTLECTMASMGGQLGVSGIWFFNKGTNNNQYDFVPSNLTNIASWRLPLNLPFLWGASSSQCNPISFFDIGIVNDIFLKDEIEYENYDQVISPNDCVINFCIKFLERFIFVVLDLDNDCSSPYYLFLFAPDYKEFMFETIINLIHSGVAIHIDPQIL
jgi:hypothetical protein